VAIATPALVARHEGALEGARLLRREIVGWSVIMAADPIEDD
jgi:hypothetical protein